ncbi:hypothetical protein E4Q08_23130, partial [Candidatus Accumulibacter phosphatis]|nr:hypothetical protein [Candidatus Accumulibacter contiguus]
MAWVGQRRSSRIWIWGDARRTRRLIKLVDDLSAQPTGSIPVACGGLGGNQSGLPAAGQSRDG